eukprot:955048-Prorocentrum_minimum.AAC.1
MPNRGPPGQPGRPIGDRQVSPEPLVAPYIPGAAREPDGPEAADRGKQNLFRARQPRETMTYIPKWVNMSCFFTSKKVTAPVVTARVHTTPRDTNQAGRCVAGHQKGG